MAVGDYPFVKCLNPTFIVDRLTGRPMLVPCNKCTACRNQRADRYTLQCRLEGQSSKYVRFTTLTFAQSTVPRLGVIRYSVPYDNMYRYNLINKETGEVVFEYSDTPKQLPFADVLKKQDCFGDFMYLDMSVASLFIKRLRSFLSRLWNTQKRYYKHLSTINQHENNIFESGHVPEIRTFIAGEYAPDHWRPHLHILFFFDSDWLASPAELFHGSIKYGFTRKVHTISEFPQWTWSKNPDCIPSPNDVLTVLEYAVRSCWTFGINETAIPKGDCSSYVASYVNSSLSLPRIFEASLFRPRCLHSNFLGQRFLKSERSKVYELSPEEFIRRSFDSDGSIKSYSLWRSAYAFFYPRIRHYSIKSAQELYDSYTVYYRAAQIFGRGARTSYIAREIVDEIIRSLHDPTLCCYDKSFLSLVDFFKSEFHDSFPDDIVNISVDSSMFGEYYMKYYCLIYTFLRVSKHFCIFCSDSFQSFAFRKRLDSIRSFYSRLDYLHLTDWYKSQQQYFSKDYANPEDVVYFYNNIEFNLSEFKQSFIFRKYGQWQIDRARDRVKHKSVTHLNLDFEL